MNDVPPAASAAAPANSVTAALATRRSIRAFDDRPVDPALLRDILAKAQASASGGNLQPWQVSVATGAARDRLIAAVAERRAMGLMGLQPEYAIYPDDLPDPWRARRYGVAAAMYGALGIGRDDKDARNAAMADNFTGFGAPVLLFLHCDRRMGPPQWGDMGIWLQSVMLLLREAGLDSCPQEAWSMFGATVRACLGAGDDQILWTGLAIGYRAADAAVNGFAVPRAPVDDCVRWTTD